MTMMFCATVGREFSETLVHEEDDDNTPIRNSIRPQHYLNVHAVEAHGKSFRLLQAMPNYFVGVGLLFTFLGLVAAIYFAKDGVASSDVKAAQESLKNLLNAATFKFLTSIAGLGSSIVLSFLYRTQIQSLQHSFDKLCQALERGMVFVTPEMIATSQLFELEKQTSELKKFNTDFAIEVGKVLEERFSQALQTNLAEALKPLGDALDGMAGNFGKMNQEAISEMTKSFGEDLKGAAGQEMDALVSALDNIQGALGNVVSQIDKTSFEFGSRMADSVGRLEDFLGAAGQSIKEQTSSAATVFADKMQASSSELAETLTPLSNQIGRFEAAINSMETKMADQRDAFADVAESVRKITGDIATIINGLRSATQPMANVADKIASAVHDVSGAGESIAQSHDRLRLLASQISDTSARMQEAWLDYQSRFEGVDKSLAGSIEQLMAGADAYRRHVESFVKGLDENLDKAVRTLHSGIESLNDSIDEFADANANNAAE
jgi:DNA anti-recombination protein RmuC